MSAGDGAPPRIGRRLAEELAVVVALTALAVVMTWPLAPNLDRAVATPGDPYLLAWTLAWDTHATFHRGPSLFDAPIFHPAKGALAFSENVYGIALFAFPLFAAGLDALTVHNVLLLMGFALSGYGAWVLVRGPTGSRLAAAAAALFFAFVPYRFTQLSHLQIVWSPWLPLLLASAICFGREPSRRHTAVLAGVLFIDGLSTIYWLWFGSTAAVAAVLVVAAKEGHLAEPRFWRRLAAACVASGVLLLPWLLPYLSAAERYGMTRGAGEVLRYSARPGDWLAPGTYEASRASATASVPPERRLGPGVVPLVLAAAGLSLFWRRRARASPADVAGERDLGALLAGALAWLVVGFVGSLGLRTPVYRFLFAHLWVLHSVRVAARWGMIADAGLAVLVGLGVLAVTRALRRAGRAGSALALGAGALVTVALLADLREAPIRWYLGTTRAAPVERWLAEHRLRGAVLELPVAGGNAEYGYLLAQTRHWKPLVNGVSGFLTPDVEWLIRAFRRPEISPAVVPRLERMGCSLVVIHADRLGAAPAVRRWLRREMARRRLVFVAALERGLAGDFLFALPAVEPAAARLVQPQAPDPAGRTPRANLNIFLGGFGTVYNARPVGAIEAPAFGADVVGKLTVRGWAAAPGGIERVNLHFGNRRLRVASELVPRPEIARLFPWLDAASVVGFTASIPRPPAGLRARTDLQPEIVDGSGRRVALQDVWLTWRRKSTP